MVRIFLCVKSFNHLLNTKRRHNSHNINAFKMGLVLQNYLN